MCSVCVFTKACVCRYVRMYVRVRVSVMHVCVVYVCVVCVCVCSACVCACIDMCLCVRVCM